MEVPPQSLSQNVDVYKRDLNDCKLVHFWEDQTYWRVIRTKRGRAIIQRYSLMLFVWRHEVEGPRCMVVSVTLLTQFIFNLFCLTKRT